VTAFRRLCVFAGSSVGGRPEYAEAARVLAGELVRRDIGLVYGGGAIGLMGVLADAVLGAEGTVIGVIPRPLAAREIAHRGVTELRVVESMHERKATMAELSDGFIALPGGLGTLEETLEILTWSQLGIHRKPVGVLNVSGYYDGLLKLLAAGVREQFIKREYVGLLLFADTPADLLDLFEGWTPPVTPTVWLDPTQT
jgi:uncharacterized protein (TIGR00730 family)